MKIRTIMMVLVLAMTTGTAQGQKAAMDMLSSYVNKKTPGAIAFAFKEKDVKMLAKYKKTEEERQAMQKIDFMGTVALRKASAEVTEKLVNDAKTVEAEGYERISTEGLDIPKGSIVMVKRDEKDKNSFIEMICYNIGEKMSAWLYIHGNFTMDDVKLLSKLQN